MIINENILKKYLSQPIPKNLKFLINNHITEVDKIEIIHPQLTLKNNQKYIIGKIIKIINQIITIDIGKNIIFIDKNQIINFDNFLINKKIIVLIEPKSQNIISSFNNNQNPDIYDRNIYNKKIISAKDLQLSHKNLIESEKNEILYLDEQAPVGKCALTYLNLKGSAITLALTPNRVDLLSHIGFAKDLNAVLESSNPQLINFQNINNNPHELDKINPFIINIKNDNCYEYSLRYIKNLIVKPSPLWLRNLLITNQIEPTNNIMDIINLIMIEYGIPLNVFDAEKLTNEQIEIRNAEPNEKICHINKTYFLRHQQDIVITNNNKIISLSNILNNPDYEITNKTQNIIITSSYWNIEIISKIAKYHQINNPQTLLLTKGIDQNLIQKALNQATYLIQKLTYGKVYKKISSQKIKQHNNPKIRISLKEINKKIGLKLSSNKIINILNKLNYKVDFISKPSQNYFMAQAPERRYDIMTPEDIIADLVRLKGFNNKTKRSTINHFTEHNTCAKNLIKLKKFLANLGFYEIKTYKLINQKIFNLFHQDQNYLSVINPINEERKILRQNLSGSMLEVLEFNHKNKNIDNAFFEISHVFYKNQEILHLSLGISGHLIKNYWLKQNIESSFFILKGVIEKIALFLNINLSFSVTKKYLNLHPGAQANIQMNKKNIGFIGEIHPKLTLLNNLSQSFIAEINLDLILKQSFNNNIIVNKINKLPYITRDLSFWISKKFNFKQILKILTKDFQKILRKCELLDVYMPKSNTPNTNQEYYSLSFRLTFENINNDLNKITIEQIIHQIENNLKNKFQAKIR
ncbi:phenylalanine--tRNA ligase subunit beta [Candidatus Phytoplasma citri]|uniref:Phenylalanine--tRNA ligase beta subunit n=1 Tax=Candidatus Phytoplasma citri TaxID=180978 RepID=A0A1S9LYM8_9MOLU|nr:phenylalanine--tRNA ligase subunit beta [Candidatus Phytoplasma aurantifolia]MDO8060049.1 phenylalanine--tRNA ligase subunit beta [Candidatus Phytoplasma aurantifolia]MDO8078657.1 phenylalanine--tRNA ligase subunit beta [Candidatus Phytoplasma aurantifolia]OOP58106.1 phenylalanine--tRNA ligase subunit beta [Candidatus Phytoplasma aurantifolia]